MNKEKTMEVIIGGDKSVRWYYQAVAYESLIENCDHVILSVIHKYKYLAECVRVLLNLSGWELDKRYDPNPREQKEKGKKLDYIICLKYHLIRTPVNLAIKEELMKDDKIKKIMVYLLDRKKIDRMEKDFNRW